MPHDGGIPLNPGPTEAQPLLRIAFDIGGVLSKYPVVLGRLMGALAPTAGVAVYVISDMPKDVALDMLARNGLGWLAPNRVISADYATHGEACKAEACAALGIDILIDDHLGYVSVPGAPPVRLLVMPDASLDYYHPEWRTDGSEGTFGRRRAEASTPTPKGDSNV